MSKGKFGDAYKVVFRKPMDEHEYFELEKVKNSRADALQVYLLWNNISVPKMKSLSSQTSKGNNGLTNVFKAVTTSCSELISLYGNRLLRRRLLICHFTFFMSSLTYYVIGNRTRILTTNFLFQTFFFFRFQALNGDNFLANQYFYVAVTGLTEVPSYIVPCIMFKWMGRKRVSLILFFIAGVALLSILTIPLGKISGCSFVVSTICYISTHT